MVSNKLDPTNESVNILTDALVGHHNKIIIITINGLVVQHTAFEFRLGFDKTLISLSFLILITSSQIKIHKIHDFHVSTSYLYNFIYKD